MNCPCLDDWNRLEYTTWFHFVVPFTGRFLFHLVSMGKCHQQTSSSAPVPTWSLSLRWDLDGLPLQEAYNQIRRFWMKLVKYSSINCDRFSDSCSGWFVPGKELKNTEVFEIYNIYSELSCRRASFVQLPLVHVPLATWKAKLSTRNKRQKKDIKSEDPLQIQGRYARM